MSSLMDRLDHAFGIRKPHRRFFHRSIPEGVNYTFCIGGIAFTLFLLLAATGALLAVYYVPSETEAYQSIVRLHSEIRLGTFIRSLHKWSAHLFIAAIVLHAIRVFVYKAYRHPRELNWIAGALTLMVALVSGFTGYLLPWDQKAYWATEVGTAIAGTLPLAGRSLLLALRGGEDVTGATLIRFYALHVLVLPILMGLLLWAHFHLVKQQGVKGGL